MALGAQDLHPEPQGAFTGEVSGGMLASVGCVWVIVGHSERRHGMGETDAQVAAKLRAAQRDGLLPIVWGSGTGSEVMSRIAAPLLGGMVTAPLLSMLVIPAAYKLMRRREVGRAMAAGVVRVQPAPAH